MTEHTTLPKGITLRELSERRADLDLPRLLGNTKALVFRPIGEQCPIYLTPAEGDPTDYPLGAGKTSVYDRDEVGDGGALAEAVVVLLTPTHRNLHEDQVLVGRALSNDVRLVSPSVSKVHVRFQLDEGEWKLRDDDSSNGTRINGVKLEPLRPYGLRAGDELTIGDVVAIYTDAEGLLDLVALVSK